MCRSKQQAPLPLFFLNLRHSALKDVSGWTAGFLASFQTSDMLLGIMCQNNQQTSVLLFFLDCRHSDSAAPSVHFFVFCLLIMCLFLLFLDRFLLKKLLQLSHPPCIGRVTWLQFVNCTLFFLSSFFQNCCVLSAFDWTFVCYKPNVVDVSSV